jgi:hypothetical protein
VKKELNLSKKKLKENLKNSSYLILKVTIPELELDWDGLYFYFKDRANNVLNKIKNKEEDNMV